MTNNQTTKLYVGNENEPDKFIEVKWKDLRVGDIVRVENNQVIFQVN